MKKLLKEEVIKERGERKDLAKIFICREDQISLTEKEVLKGDIVFHYKDLDLNNFTSTKDLKLLEKINGGPNLSRLTPVEREKISSSY